jgi:RNA 2',3'-cyclic 3'-phosphodiesterase
LKPQPPEPTQRLFFALWPTAAQQRALALATRKAARHSGGRTVPEDKLHVTLAFLGSVAQRRLPELSQIGAECAARLAQARPLVVTFDRLEHWARVQVLVAAGAGDPQPAHALAEALKGALAVAGFTPDLKPFRAHVTVARKVARPTPAPTLQPVEWQLHAFALIDSRTEASGPIYSVVESFALVKAEKARE